MRKLVGLKIHYLTDSNGRIEKVVGARELQTKLTATATPQAKSILGPLLHEENLKRVVMLDSGLPDRTVKVGDSWPEQRDQPMGQMGTVQVNTTNAFRGWEEHDQRRCAIIEFTGTVANKPGGPPTPLSMSIENGRTSGKSWFDPASGMVVVIYHEQEMTIKIVSGGRNFETKITSKVSVKVTEGGDIPQAN